MEEQKLNKTNNRMKNGAVLAEVKEVHATEDIAEVVRLLASGDWIALLATAAEPHIFCMGRVSGGAGSD